MTGQFWQGFQHKFLTLRPISKIGFHGRERDFLFYIEYDFHAVVICYRGRLYAW